MGVYINMSMPTSCRKCWLKINCDDCEGYECYCLPLQTEIGYLKDLLTDKRRDDCPLVPVPPHGRLIDADEFLKNAQLQRCFRGDYALLLNDVIEECTTIIPASEEGE